MALKKILGLRCLVKRAPGVKMLYMQQASYLEGVPLMWILPLYLHDNQKSDDDDDDNDDTYIWGRPTVSSEPFVVFPFYWIPGLATYFFRFFKKGSCQLLAKVCARSTG